MGRRKGAENRGLGVSLFICLKSLEEDCQVTGPQLTCEGSDSPIFSKVVVTASKVEAPDLFGVEVQPLLNLADHCLHSFPSGGFQLLSLKTRLSKTTLHIS